jgi:ubiquinone/menaquinone biosynthesis C-methylase UbiE
MSIERERVTSSGWFPNWIRHEHLARYRFAASLAAGKEVVDCACGDGTASRLMAEGGAVRVRAFDLSEETIAEARAAHPLPNVRFEPGDATALPLADDSADLYVSLETIEHLPDVGRFLDEVLRVLRPTGTFVCSTPDRDVYSPGHELESRPWNRFHVRELSQPEFAALLASRFREVALFGQNAKLPQVTALKGRLGRVLPADLMVRLNQAAKLPRLAYDKVEHHLVVPVDARRRYEILVAVCTGPKR